MTLYRATQSTFQMHPTHRPEPPTFQRVALRKSALPRRFLFMAAIGRIWPIHFAHLWRWREAGGWLPEQTRQ
jgi:hypothetical protein